MKPFNYLFVFLFVFASIIGCGNQPNKTNNTNNEKDSTLITKPEKIEKTLEPLKSEDIKLKNKNPFGETIELNGEHLIADTMIFKVDAIQMLVKNNLLLIQNRNYGNLFMIFELPSLKLIKSFGKIGNGPDEFNSAQIMPTTDDNMLAYAIESNKHTVYSISFTGDIAKIGFSLPRWSPTSGNIQPGMIDGNNFFYETNSPSGKSIYKVELVNDSTKISEVQSLSLNPKRKGWANYIGDFAMNAKKNRIVYAYKYFKIVRFFDTENNSIRTINFEKEEFDEGSLAVLNGLDKNVTHYWGICPQNEYVYILYSGRTPYDVGKDSSKGLYYIFVEKFDWNGNPIAKYKLDRWGYFTVDEKNSHLYIASTNDDDPLFRYILP